MPLITVKAGTPAIPPGSYLADLISISPKRMITQYSKNGEEQDFLEWTWLVHGKEKQAEITSLTTTATGPKSRIFEYLVALLGADKVVVDAGFEENDLVGKRAMVQIIATDDGFAKIDRIMGAPESTTVIPAPAPVAPPLVAALEAAQDKDDDLPF